MVNARRVVRGNEAEIMRQKIEDEGMFEFWATRNTEVDYALRYSAFADSDEGLGSGSGKEVTVARKGSSSSGSSGNKQVVQTSAGKIELDGDADAGAGASTHYARYKSLFELEFNRQQEEYRRAVGQSAYSESKTPHMKSSVSGNAFASAAAEAAFDIDAVLAGLEGDGGHSSAAKSGGGKKKKKGK